MSETAVATPPNTNQEMLVARLAAGRNKFKSLAGETAKALEAARAEVTRLATENTQLKESGSTKRVAELESQIREGKHREAFGKVAKSKGVDESMVNDLYSLSGYKAESDEIDEAAISKVIDDQKASRPKFFGETPAPGEQKPPPKPGPASGQGSGAPFQVTTDPDRLSDIRYQMENYSAISKAAAERVASGQI